MPVAACSEKPPFISVRDAAGELDHLEAALHLPHRVREHLAVLVGEDARDLLAAVVDELADAEEDLRALRERRRAPGGEGRGGGRDGRVHLLDGGERDLLRLLAGGRVVDGAAAAGRPRHARAADPVADLPQLARIALWRALSRPRSSPWSVARYHRVMATIEDRAAEAEKVLADDREYLIHSWSVQSALKPLAVAGAEGRYFWDYDGKRYLDFASQLVNVSSATSTRRVIQAIKDQADKLCTIGPPMANDKRSELARLVAEVMPGDLNHTFFTNGGAEANENAIKTRPLGDRPPQGDRALPLVPRSDGRRDHAHGRPPPLVRRARHAGRRRACSTRTRTAAPPGIPTRARSARAGRTWRRSSSTRARTRSPP